MLMLDTLTEESVMQFGLDTLDLYLIKKAKQRSQDVEAIEYVREHCHALNSLSPAQVMSIITGSLFLYRYRIRRT